MAQDCEQSLEGPGNYCRFRDPLKLCFAYNTAQVIIMYISMCVCVCVCVCVYPSSCASPTTPPVCDRCAYP